MMATKSVLVMMSTYNGALYLKEQLDSIFCQIGVDVFLLVRDDGSNDATCSILEEYSDKHNNLIWNKGINLGFVNSFSALIRKAIELNHHFDFYAFADQDDIWDPEKLRVACNCLSLKNDKLPNLFTCNSIMIDSNGDRIGLFHEQEPYYSRGNVLVFSTEQGCSMVFNSKALELYNGNPPKVTFHDRWMNLICFYLGETYYSHTPLFFYRLHGGNALGQVHMASDKRGLLYKVSRLLSHYTDGKPLTKHVEMSKEFLKCFGNMISEKDKKLFLIYISYRYKVSSKLYMLFSNNYKCPYSSLKQRVRFFLYLLFSKL